MKNPLIKTVVVFRRSANDKSIIASSWKPGDVFYEFIETWKASLGPEVKVKLLERKSNPRRFIVKGYVDSTPKERNSTYILNPNDFKIIKLIKTR